MHCKPRSALKKTAPGTSWRLSSSRSFSPLSLLLAWPASIGCRQDHIFHSNHFHLIILGVLIIYFWSRRWLPSLEELLLLASSPRRGTRLSRSLKTFSLATRGRRNWFELLCSASPWNKCHQVPQIDQTSSWSDGGAKTTLNFFVEELRFRWIVFSSV